MKVSDKSAKPVRLSGEDLIAGEVYKDEGGSIVMCTDENSVVCLKTGIVMDFMSGEYAYYPVDAELVLS